MGLMIGVTDVEIKIESNENSKCNPGIYIVKFAMLCVGIKGHLDCMDTLL
jgi:hypothetical protein